MIRRDRRDALPQSNGSGCGVAPVGRPERVGYPAGAAGAWPSLAAGLIAHAREGYLGFHMPGHHQGRAAWPPWRDLLGEAVFNLDLTELPGLDNLQDPQGIIGKAAADAAAFFGAAETHFLVNGSSAGILAVLLATCREGDRVLLPRNCHQSVVHGLILSGATPVYLPVRWNPELGLPGLLETQDLRAALSDLPEPAENCALGDRDQSPRQVSDHTPVVFGRQHARRAPEQDTSGKLLVLLHPNFYGLSGELAKQIELAHQRGLPVLVDEAHGSHFCAGSSFPAPALRAGADYAVHGVHKTLGAFTQAAMLHCRDGVHGEKIIRVLRLVQTTSPSYLLLASLDVARDHLQQSQERWEETALLGMRLRREISRVPGLSAPAEELLNVPGVAAYDPSRLVVNVSALGNTGFTAADWLRRQRRILVEMADLQNLVFILGPGDIGPAADTLLEGLQALAAACGTDDGNTGKSASSGNGGDCGYGGKDLPIPRQVLTPRQAFFASRCEAPLEAAAGRIAAQVITPYPPGVPVICPGEEISRDLLEHLAAWRKAGGTWPGQARGTVSVVDENQANNRD